ncbi:MAG: adenylosuccinate lyase, partial [Lentisphaerae bacterium]|nr:adenylosuccinate lyase [Lentisphaerota bacterium]
FPESFILTDYLLRQLLEVLRGLVVDEAHIKRNLDFTGGLIMSERVMLGLTERGMGRQEAHEVLRQVAGQAFTGGRSLREVLAETPSVTALLTTEDIDRLLDPAEYIGTAVEQVQRVLRELRAAK